MSWSVFQGADHLDRENLFQIGMRPRNDMHRHEFANTLGSGCTGIGCSLAGRHVTAYESSHQPTANLLVADQLLGLP